MRIYHIQVNRLYYLYGILCASFQIKDWLSSSGNPVPASLERFRQSEDFLESLLTERNYSHPLALVSADKSTYVGVFILSRIMLHTTRHGGRSFGSSQFLTNDLDSDIDASPLVTELRHFNPKFVTSQEQFLFSYELLLNFLQNLRLI